MMLWHFDGYLSFDELKFVPLVLSGTIAILVAILNTLRWSLNIIASTYPSFHLCYMLVTELMSFWFNIHCCFYVLGIFRQPLLAILNIF